MSRGPLPSQLCLLSELWTRNERDKVRFLGCVISYNTSKASYILGHSYPKSSNVTVKVDAQLLASTLGEETTRVGEWLNIIGYISTLNRGKGSRKGKQKQADSQVEIQALVIWPAGPLDLGRYEATFEQNT